MNNYNFEKEQIVWIFKKAPHYENECKFSANIIEIHTKFPYEKLISINCISTETSKNTIMTFPLHWISKILTLNNIDITSIINLPNETLNNIDMCQLIYQMTL